MILAVPTTVTFVFYFIVLKTLLRTVHNISYSTIRLRHALFLV
jgi:hypothetical protein